MISDLREVRNEMVKSLISVNLKAIDQILSDIERDSWSLEDIVENLLAPALKEVGILWENEKISLSQMYMAGKICDDLIHFRYGDYKPDYVKNSGKKIAICCLEDYHGLGKKIVRIVVESAGYNLIDYGIGIIVKDLALKIEHDHIDIILISTLMLSSAFRIRDLRDMLDRFGKNDVIIIVGGAPFNFDDKLVSFVRADYFGKKPSDAVKILDNILGYDSYE